MLTGSRKHSVLTASWSDRSHDDLFPVSRDSPAAPRVRGRRIGTRRPVVSSAVQSGRPVSSLRYLFLFVVHDVILTKTVLLLQDRLSLRATVLLFFKVLPPPSILPPAFLPCYSPLLHVWQHKGLWNRLYSSPNLLPWQSSPNNQQWHVNYGYYVMKTVPRTASGVAFLWRVERMKMSEVKRCGQHNS